MIITHYFHEVYGFENRLWDNMGREYTLLSALLNNTAANNCKFFVKFI